MAGRPRQLHKRVSDAHDHIRTAGGILVTVAPETYFDGTFSRESALSKAWTGTVDAILAACDESEALLELLRERAGFPPEPESPPIVIPDPPTAVYQRTTE